MSFYTPFPVRGVELKHQYYDYLGTIHANVGSNLFTLAGVRPLFKPGDRVNGSVLLALRQARLVEKVHKGDVNTKGSHFVHQYRITIRGRRMIAQGVRNKTSAIAEC